jgi:hypothetical protein
MQFRLKVGKQFPETRKGDKDAEKGFKKTRAGMLDFLKKKIVTFGQINLTLL